MFVKPKPGLKVRDPDTKGFLPPGGAQVPPSLYWTRRVRDGDALVSEPPSSAPAAFSAPAQAEEPVK